MGLQGMINHMVKLLDFPTLPFHDLDPMRVVWHGNYMKYFEIARDGLTLAPFRTIRPKLSGPSALPPLLGSERATGTKSLAAPLRRAI